MKILTVIGTRPEYIRLSKIIPRLDEVCQHVLVNTNQSYDDNMAGVFFRELNIRGPDYNLGVKSATVGEQIAKILQGMEEVIAQEKPDRLLILGDTNSALSAFVAKRMGVKVYHMEAGNRCYEDRVPEEINRRVIDSCSDVLMPYTERSRANLIREGYASQNIYVTGNPIAEVIKDIENTPILSEMGMGIPKMQQIASTLMTGSKLVARYFLVTAHRQENVDNDERLSQLLDSLAKLANEYEIPVIFSCHPRTKKRMEESEHQYVPYYKDKIIIHAPFGLQDFVTLEKYADCVLTDSGTVQEECAIFKVPCVTLRDVTERPETIECGSNILSGVEPDSILRCVKAVLSREPNWQPPEEYLRTNVSDTVLKIVTGY